MRYHYKITKVDVTNGLDKHPKNAEINKKYDDLTGTGSD